MKRDCIDLWDALVQLAEGQENRDAKSHLESCVDCQRRFAQLELLVTGLKTEYHEPPEGLRAWAKNLMPKKLRLRMTLLRTTLALSGARSATADFQSVFVSDETEVRVMYSKLADGWEVVSKTPSSEWAVNHDFASIESDETGRFRFIAPNLDLTGFQLERTGQCLVVPSGAEAVSSGNQATS